jgi:GNAT superfamily N-acetyltransferase
MSDLEIRPVCADDLPSLIRAGGQAAYFAERFARQERGAGVLIGAWLGDRAVGSVYLWLEPAEEPEIRRHLGDEIPLLTHLEVFKGEDRNRGYGTLIVDAAENWLRANGQVKVALAVEMSNADASRLYKRLGYLYWDHDRVNCIQVDWLPDGSFREFPEICDVLVKRLD